MPGRREIVVFGAVGLAAAAAGILVGPLRRPSPSDTGPLLATAFPDSSGRPHQLNQWLGRPVVLNFWATWCVPCREEVPLLVNFYGKYKPKSVELVGICADEVVKMLEFSRSYKITYPLLVADPSVFDLMRSLGNRTAALPFTLVLDRQGAVAHRRLGALKPGELEEVITPMLG
jgi:thiol-disulfide isomerase/thioredoxin